jgi:hypothetical protein
MKQYLEEEEVKDHCNNGPVQNGHDWQSDAVKPLDDPQYKGIYEVKTYDKFFKSELEKSKSATQEK